MALPDGWVEGVIGDLVGEEGLFVDGDWVESKDQDPNGDVRLIQLADIGDGAFLNKSARFLTEKRAKELGATFLSVGDVLVARMPDPLGRAAIFPGDAKKSITAVDVCVVRSKAACNRWLMHSINSPQFRGKVAALQSGSTRKRISRGNLATVDLRIPPGKEQERIADKCDELVSDLDGGVAALERAQDRLKLYRASVLKAAVEGRLTEKWRAAHAKVERAEKLLERILAERRKKWEEAQLRKFEEKGRAPLKGWKGRYPEPVKPDVLALPVLPEGWCWATVDQLGDVFSGNTPADLPSKLREDGDMQWFRVGDMNRPENTVYLDAGGQRLMAEDAIQLGLRIAEAGTIVFPKRGGAIATNKKRLLRRRSCFDLNTMGVTPIVFAADWLWSWFLQLDLARLSDGSNVPQINHPDIKPLNVPLPPSSEQGEIKNLMEEQLSVCAVVDAQMNALRARATRLRQAILKCAFEGRLVLQDPKDEPASELLARIRAVREAGKGLIGRGNGRKKIRKKIRTMMA
jgi:type I restriction enzyme S subunit